MESKLVINKIKTLLGLDTKENFTDAKLADGTIVRFDNLEVGSTISSIDVDGNIIPLIPGEYTLEDKTIVTVEVDGIIATVIPFVEVDAKLSVTEGLADPIMNPEDPSTQSETQNVVDILALIDKITILENNIDYYNTSFNTLELRIKALEDSNTSLSTQVEELSKQPASESVVKQFNKTVSSDGIDAIKKYLKK